MSNAILQKYLSIVFNIHWSEMYYESNLRVILVSMNTECDDVDKVSAGKLLVIKHKLLQYHILY